MSLLKNISKIFSKGKRIAVPSNPSFVLMEATNACNLRCRMCFIYGENVEKKREIGFIKKESWQPAIDEIGSWPASTTLDLHGAGEPLLHPDLFDIVSYAKSKDNTTVGFLCNATLLDKEKAQAVVETGVDWIGFSVDGAQKEIFEYYRKGAVLEQVEENIEYFLSIKKGKPTTYINMVCHLEADINMFINKWKGKVDTILLSIKRANVKEKNKPVILQKPCQLLYQQLIMGWDGKTVLCCEDYYGDYITGNFPEKSLYEIWHGSAMTKIRTLHETGRPRKIELCRYCDSVVFHEYNEEVMEINGKKTLIRRELPAIKE